ncbi:MAG: hypothetical protein R2799_12035 [Crocinitomicaceae bacterium]
MDNKHSIILIGKLATGISLAKKLSAHNGYKNYPVNRCKRFYQLQNGYDINQSRKILQVNRFGGLINYAHRYFGGEDLEDLLFRFKGIVDLGASDTITEILQPVEQTHYLFERSNPLFNRSRNFIQIQTI